MQKQRDRWSTSSEVTLSMRQGCLHRGTSKKTSFKSREDLPTQQRTRTEEETFQERGEVKMLRWKLWDISTHQVDQAGYSREASYENAKSKWRQASE